MTSGGPVLSRRHLLAALSAAGSLALPRVPGAWAGTASSGSDPFTLGVASGDPRSTSVVLWTRLARKPLYPLGGMGDKPVRVEWKVSIPGTRRVVASGAVYAQPAAAHSVHVVATGLEPGRWYHYRFRALGFVSPPGRTRTLPPAGSMPPVFRFGMVSCQDYEEGYYTAYRRLAQEKLDLVLHLGDYIYEGPRSQETSPRYHVGGETKTLAEYRVRHAQYKLDPDLQAAHRRFPWMVTFDDHDVDNNWTSESNTSRLTDQAFRTRQAAALRAYYEHMPLRRSSLPVGPDMRIYRRIDVGRLVRISVLDTRQYRSAQACGGARDKFALMCAEAAAENRTITGPEQEQWLLRGLDRTARWNVVAQQVMMARWTRVRHERGMFNMDAWDGYPAARRRILEHLAANRPTNTVVLTGDAHLHALAELKMNFDDPLSQILATEIVTTSISSGGNGKDAREELLRRQVVDPHLKFLNRRRGYIRHVLTPNWWRADFRTVRYVSTPGAPASTRASWVMRDGVPGAYEVDPVP